MKGVKTDIETDKAAHSREKRGLLYERLCQISTFSFLCVTFNLVKKKAHGTDICAPLQCSNGLDQDQYIPSRRTNNMWSRCESQ